MAISHFPSNSQNTPNNPPKPPEKKKSAPRVQPTPRGKPTNLPGGKFSLDRIIPNPFMEYDWAVGEPGGELGGNEIPY